MLRKLHERYYLRSHTTLSCRWFEKEPSVVAVFPRYAGKSLGELKALPRIRSHGTHIFLAIACVLINIENYAVTSELLADLKRDHAMFKPNISADAFNVRHFYSSGHFLPSNAYCLTSSLVLQSPDSRAHLWPAHRDTLALVLSFLWACRSSR